MLPGLHRLHLPECSLTPLLAGSALHASKRQQVDRALLAGYGADTPALQQQTLDSLYWPPGQHRPPAGQPRFWQELAMQFEEDIVVLDAEDLRVRLLMVCSPSGWTPEHVLGLDFVRIHAQVADNERIMSASAGLAQTLRKAAWQRWVWTLSPSGDFDRHPSHGVQSQWPLPFSDEKLGNQIWMRVEHQKLIPMAAPQGSTGLRPGILFAIRVLLCPLASAVRTTEQARRLMDSLNSMSDAILEYKNLGPIRDRAVRWLASQWPRFGQSSTSGATPGNS